MDKNDIRDKLQSHVDHITTAKEWDDYAKKHDLPPSFTLIKKFGTWNELKNALNIPTIVMSYEDEDLKKIAMEHKEYIVSKRAWDSYYKEKGLPSSSTFIKHFGKWSNIKQFVGYNTDRPKNDLYSNDDILKILKSHADNFQNRTQWDVYAKENRLPTYKTIKKHFDYDEILEIVQKRKSINFTERDLLKIVKENNEVFFTSSISRWNEYAAENKLPSSHVFIRKFGTWRKAKYELRSRI